MRIVVIGATAYARRKTCRRLRRAGHEAKAAATYARPHTTTEPPDDDAGRHLRHLLQCAFARLAALRRPRVPSPSIATGDHHEDRDHRRNRPHRFEGRGEAAPERP